MHFNFQRISEFDIHTIIVQHSCCFSVNTALAGGMKDCKKHKKKHQIIVCSLGVISAAVCIRLKASSKLVRFKLAS